MRKVVINLNGSPYYKLPDYSGWLGSYWYEEGREKEREKYIEQIKGEKISKIKSNNLSLESINGDTIRFSKTVGDTYTFFAFTFSGNKELQEILERTNSKEKI